MIVFNNVTKKFKKKEVLSGISFSISPGEFVFLTGQSGSGKSTIIRLIIKELNPDGGEIKVGNFELKKINSGNLHLLRRKVGVIFQDLKLLNDKTLYENIYLALEACGLKERKTKKQIENILDFVGIKDKKNYFPQELAGGEKQRAAIARAVITNPDIILADEPTADLDPATSWQIIQLFNKLNKLGKTILFATHNADIVNSLRKRVIKVKNGKIIKDELEGKY